MIAVWCGEKSIGFWEMRGDRSLMCRLRRSGVVGVERAIAA